MDSAYLLSCVLSLFWVLIVQYVNCTIIKSLRYVTRDEVILASSTTMLQPVCSPLNLPGWARSSVLVLVGMVFSRAPRLPDMNQIGTERQCAEAMEASKQTGSNEIVLDSPWPKKLCLIARIAWWPQPLKQTLVNIGNRLIQIEALLLVGYSCGKLAIVLSCWFEMTTQQTTFLEYTGALVEWHFKPAEGSEFLNNQRLSKTGDDTEDS